MLLLVATILAHGGPPVTYRVVDEAPTLATSHGYLTGERSWLCEELAGDEFATGIARAPSGWVMSTTSGLLTSPEGCDWTFSGYPDELLTDVAVDDSGSVWVGTHSGVFRDGELVYDPGFSLRDYWRDEDSFMGVGYDDEGVAWLSRGDALTELPEATGALSIEHVGAQGTTFVQVPSGLEDRLFRVTSDGKVEDLFGPVDPIVGVTEHQGQVYVAHRLGGVRRFDGEQWSEPSGPSLTCLRQQDGQLWGCPEDYLTALAREVSGSPDPTQWQWEAMTEFVELSPLDCPEDSTYAQLCMPLWSTVEEELNWQEEDERPSESETGEGPEFTEAGAQGCSLAPTGGRTPAGLLLLLGLWGLRRRVD